MTLRIFSDEGKCRRCSDCVGCDHHWLFVSFPPFDTDDPEFRQDVQDWWERTGHDECVCPAFWSCKHCSAWTPDDPDEDESPNDSELPNSSKHTPGPWNIFHGGLKGDDGFSVGSDNIQAERVKVVAECWPCTIVDNQHRDELRANARLIAAAPELLEALQAIIFKAGDLLLEHGWTHEVQNAVEALQKVDE